MGFMARQTSQQDIASPMLIFLDGEGGASRFAYLAFLRSWSSSKDMKRMFSDFCFLASSFPWGDGIQLFDIKLEVCVL
jgi:hypothetical protein